MEKSGDFGRQDVTPSAPPSYSEAVGDFAEASGLYPAIPIQPSQGYLFPSSVAQPPVNPQIVSGSYPVQDGLPLSQRPVGIGMLPVGPKPLKTVCPSCQKHVATRTNTKNLFKKYFCCVLLFASVICIPCACVPFCVCPPTKIEHFCPSCNAYLGTYVK